MHPMTAPRTSENDSRERIYTSFSKRRRVQSEQKLPREDTYNQSQVDVRALRGQVAQAMLHKNRVITFIQVQH